MELRKVGRSNIEASVIGLGTFGMGSGAWWGDFDEEEAVKSLIMLPEVGINNLDTAPIYGLGKSEELIGKALKQMKREDIIISTKCGNWWHDVRGSKRPVPYYGVAMYKALDRSTIKTEVEMSLKRLGTDYIDIYYTHSQAEPPVMTTIEESMDALNELKKEGKILSIGAGNVNIHHLEEYVKWGQLDMIQQEYSILYRDIEADVVPFCIEHNISIQTYSVLEKGLLSGRYNRSTAFPEGNIRNNRKWFQPGNIDIVLDMLDGWKDLCEKYGCSMGNLVIAWTKQQPGITNVLCGARKIAHIRDNANAANVEITKEDMARMNKDIADNIK